MSKAKKTAYTKLVGSEKHAPVGNQVEAPSPEQTMEVTVRLRRKKSIDSELKKGVRYSRADFDEAFGAKQSDVEKIEAFANNHHLAVSNVDTARRSVMLKGSVKDFEEAFQVKLGCYVGDDGKTFRGRQGHINIPADLQGIVEGVFGLDDRPNARPMFQYAPDSNGIAAPKSVTQSFPPGTVASLYGFPSKANGKGQCIAIIELGGGYRVQDLNTYFSKMKITPQPTVTAISVDGGKNNPTNANSADGEVMLDIEVAGAVAPGAKIVVYFAPNTDKGFLDAITQAIHDNQNKPSVISISWGSAEKNWTTQSLNNFNEAFKSAALLGVTICAAAGDQGSSDAVNDGKVHVDFPSSSPYVLACGGTKLTASGTKITGETVWHVSKDSATGGGISDFFPLPDYQKKTTIPASLNGGFKGRGLPDVAGNADPTTGYQVRVDGQDFVIGGTSAVAPLMSAFIALTNQQKKKQVGFINPQLYSTPNSCRDITVGDNITTSGNKGFKAGVGWDACTGWGVLSKL
jgi:kumamolisin